MAFERRAVIEALKTFTLGSLCEICGSRKKHGFCLSCMEHKRRERRMEGIKYWAERGVDTSPPAPEACGKCGSTYRVHHGLCRRHTG